MTVNSGCLRTSSHAEVVTDVMVKQVHNQARKEGVHCSWVEKNEFEVDFTTGEVFPGTNWGCEYDGSCRP